MANSVQEFRTVLDRYYNLDEFVLINFLILDYEDMVERSINSALKKKEVGKVMAVAEQLRRL